MTCCPNGSTPKDKPRSLSMFGFDNLVQYSSKKKTAAKKKRQYKCECRFRRTVGRCRSSLNNASLGLCFFIVCSFLFFCEFVVPLIITKAELCRRRLGFTMADLTAVIQKLLDRASSVVSFWTCCIADLISIIL